MSKRLTVKVIPSAKVDQIQLGLDGNLKIWVTSKPVDGEANKKVIELLAKHLGIRKSVITIVMGSKSRNKVVEISE